MNAKRVERIWRQEGLNVLRRQPKRGRLWLADGSCVSRRAERRNHVSSYDFVFERTHDGRPLRMLTLLDEYSRECLAIDVERRLASEDVLERLEALFVSRGTPEFIRSDNGAEFTAKAVREWLARVNVKTLFIAPGSPWENGYIESFNGKLLDRAAATYGIPRSITVDNGSEFFSKAMDTWAYGSGVRLDFIRPGKPVENAYIESFNGRLRDECLNVEIFFSIDDARKKLERWRIDYNADRPHSSLGNLAPVELERRSQANRITEPKILNL